MTEMINTMLVKLFTLIVIGHMTYSANGFTYKTSLVFVIDRTSSMRRVINQVQLEASNVLNAILNSASSRIEDFILITFDDPNVTGNNGTDIKCWTKNETEYMLALNNISLTNGGTCPEYSMSGIEQALNICKPNSFMYVFTDASAADHEKIDVVTNLSQKKGVQINFLLTGQCKKFHGQHYVVYEQLTEATSGQIFNLKKDDITKVTKYITQSVKDSRTILKRKDVYKDNESLEFSVDSKMSDVMISVSSHTPAYLLLDTDGNEIKTEKIVQTEKAAVDIVKLKPSNYTIRMKSYSISSIVLSAATTVSFQYGFSPVEPAFLNETSTKPVQGPKGNQHLSIKLDNEARNVKLLTAELRDIDDKILNHPLPLKLINEELQLFTTEPFVPPRGDFKIAINGITDTKEHITRVSTCTTEYQDPKLEPSPPYMAPEVTISKSKINVEFNAPLMVSCIVSGCPKPEIAWVDETGLILSSEPASMIDYPCKYVSVLEIKAVNKNMTVTCRAVSSKGDRDAKSMKIET